MRTSFILPHFCTALLCLAALDASAKPAPNQKSAKPAITAQLSGLDAKRPYDELPPVLLEVTGLARSATLWFEVSSEANPSKVVRLDPERILRRKSGVIVNVTGLERICVEPGTWTVTVHCKQNGRTHTLTHASFIRFGARPLLPMTASL